MCKVPKDIVPRVQSHVNVHNHHLQSSSLHNAHSTLAGAAQWWLQITSMSTLKDEERLDLLKEIGGSKVYEDRRKESLDILHDAEARKQQISELV